MRRYFFLVKSFKNQCIVLLQTYFLRFLDFNVATFFKKSNEGKIN